MSLKDHKDYNEEIEKLKFTVEYIETAIIATEDNRKHLKEDLKEAYSELDSTDSSLSYVRIMNDSRFLDRLEKNYDGLLRSRKKPYFCRIDFQHDGSSNIYKLYIGKMSLSKVEDDSPLIVDWRSPIASVYYDGRLGHVTYETPVGTETGELHLKRQYTINDGKLENILDVDITATDAFLQAALGENKDNKLKDIVSTIQSEQNDIIRADIRKPLIVQGSAGSGKTTIALHRIAYLIYTYEKTFDPDNFLIIAPNRLFLNYISDVLPELGVEKVKQTTFIDLAYDLTGIAYKLTSPDEKLIRFISHNNGLYDNELSLLSRVSGFKGSLEFRDIINNYVSKLEQNFIPNQDFKIGKFTIFTVAEINDMVDNQLSNLPLYKKIEKLKKTLSNKLRKYEIAMLKKIQDYYDKQINQISIKEVPSEDRRKKLVELMDIRNEKLEYIKKECKTAVAIYFRRIPKRKVIDYYKELLTDIQLYSGVMDNEFEAYFSKHNDALLSDKKIELEDLTPIMYLKYKILGLDKKMIIKYLVIDEAQDFSIFQLYTLKEIFNTEYFTILGDLTQGIHSYRGIKNWNDVLERVFEKGKSRYLTLEQSYRTTIEIMDVANEIIKMSNIPGLVLAKPVVRHGEKPCIYRFSTQDKMIEAVEKRLIELKKYDYSTIAVICKTEEECNKVKMLLDKRKKISVVQLNSEDVIYNGGVVIVPSYMAKGLEFDAVIIISIDESYLIEELDLKLLYVAMTRALHSMDVMYLDNTMELLEQMDKSKIKYSKLTQKCFI